MNIFTVIYRRFFPAPTVGSIMASFEKQQRALDAITADCFATESRISDSMIALQEELERTATERSKARRIANNLKQFTE